MKHSTSILALPLLLSGCVLDLPGDFPEQDEVCEFDQAREDERATSAANFPTPQIQRLLVNGNERWSSRQRRNWCQGTRSHWLVPALGQALSLIFPKS